MKNKTDCENCVLLHLKKEGLDLLIMHMFVRMNLVDSFQEGNVPNY